MVQERLIAYMVFTTSVAKVEVEDMERLRNTVTWRTGKLRNVRSTRTILVMERW